jgi:Flp pilus assembly secretin CpaC
MRPIVLALVSAIAIISHDALAVDPPAQPPTPVVSHAQSASPAIVRSKEQIDHLKSAAEHLANAGRKDEADKLREQIAAFESGQAEALLAKKEKELDAIRAEVEQLRKQTGRQPQIVLAFQIFEVSRTKLQDADNTHVQLLFPNVGEKHLQPRMVAEAAAVREAVEALRKKDLLKVLAEPTMVTISGREVWFNAGGEFPIILPQAQGTVSVEYRKYGTGVEALPVLVGNRKVRIGVRAKVSELDAANGITINGSKIPALRERVVDTSAELRFGEVLVLNGPKQTRIEKQTDAKGKTREVSDEIEMLVVITPEQVDPQETAMLPNPVRKGHGGYLQTPPAAKATLPNPVGASYVPAPTATKATQPKSRK